MTRRGFQPLGALATLVAGVLLGTVSLAGQTETPPSIQGSIVDNDTRQPLSPATITLLQGGTDVGTATADTDGLFRFVGIPDGVYQLLAESEGYQPAVSGEIRVLSGKTAVLQFELARLTLSESVVVTAPSAPVDTRAPVAAVAFGREEIRRAPGSAGDVFRAIDSLPGVAATGEFTSFSVRGRGPRDNLILVDGIPFDKVVHFDQTIGEQDDIDGGGRFSIFAPNLIQDIQFQAGGFPAAYGGKNGSLLRLEVAEGNPVTPSFSGRIEITGWEFNYDGPTYLFGNTSVIFSARAQDFGRLFRLIGENDIGRPTLEDVIVKTSSELGPRHRLNVLAVLSPERFTRDLDNVVASENFDDTALARTEQDSGLLGVTWQWLTSDRGFVRNTFFYRKSDKQSSRGESFPELIDGAAPGRDEIATRPDIFSVTESEEEIGWRSDVSIVRPDGDQLELGGRLTHTALDFSTDLSGDWIRFVYDQNDSRPDPSQNFIVLRPEFVDATFRDDALRAAAYGDYAWQLGQRVTFTPGIRWDYDGFSGESLWSPRVSTTVSLSGSTRLNLAGGIFYQYPRFLELAGNPENAALRNERSRQALVGLTHTFGDDIRVSAETYYQTLDRLVVRPDRTTGLATNSGDGYSTGLDLILAKRLVDRWYGQVTYSFQRSRRDDGLGEGAYDADFNRPLIFNTLVAYEFSDRWSLAGKWRYASGRPTDDFVVREDVFNDPSRRRFSKELIGNNILRYPDFHTLNVRLDYRRRLGRVSLITFLDIFNVYGHQNVDSLQWQERTGENIEQGLSAFPTFGVKFEY